MRGSIFRELILVFAFFGILLIPMIRLTGSPAIVEQAPQSAPSAAHTVSAWLTIRFAHSPEHFKITSGNTVLWETREVERPSLDREIALPIHEASAELNVQVTWPPGTPETVCEITLEPDGLSERVLAVWGETSLDEILSFSWSVD